MHRVKQSRNSVPASQQPERDSLSSLLIRVLKRLKINDKPRVCRLPARCHRPLALSVFWSAVSTSLPAPVVAERPRRAVRAITRYPLYNPPLSTFRENSCLDNQTLKPVI